MVCRSSEPLHLQISDFQLLIRLSESEALRQVMPQICDAVCDEKQMASEAAAAIERLAGGPAPRPAVAMAGMGMSFV